MISRENSGIHYLEQYELVSSKLLNWCQLLGTVPYPLDLRSFSEPQSVHQSTELLLRSIQLLSTSLICVYYGLSVHRMFHDISGWKLYSFVLFLLSYTLNALCIPLVFVTCHRLKKRYRELSTKIGGLLYAYQQQVFEIKPKVLLKWHRNVLVGFGAVLILTIILKIMDKFSKGPLFAIGVDLLPEVIAVSCLIQYFYAMAIVRLIVRCSSIMISELKPVQDSLLVKRKMTFLLRRVRIVIEISNEVDRSFGIFVLLQLLLIIVVGSRVLWCAAWFYDLKTVEPDDAYYLVYSLLLGFVQGLKLVLITYPHHSILCEVIV